jgi:hypothetical protein
MSLNIKNGGMWDVIVLGGGPSGAIAATAAGMCGARTLLVEKQGFLGGSLTSMGVGPMMSFHNKAGRQVVKGLPQRLVDRLMARGASPGHVPDSITYCSTVTPFDSEALKEELELLVIEHGGTLLYHTQLADVETSGNQVVAAILCHKAGLSRERAKTFIDATGDADFAARAGVAFQFGRDADSATQPMTMNLKVGNVDSDRIRAYAEANPQEFWFLDGPAAGLERLRASPRVSLGGFLSLWREAKAKGEVDVPRSDVLFFETATPGVYIVNTSRIQGLDATNPFDLSRAEVEGRRQCRQIFRFLNTRCPGFESALMIGTGPHIGVRETRHTRGQYMLTAEDLVQEVQFPDAIATGGYPIDIHSPTGEETNSVHLPADIAYQVPMRSLLPIAPHNLVFAGRGISATHEAAAAFRVTPIAMAIGQAAGTLAALSALDPEGRPPSRYPATLVRERLLADGAFLGRTTG